MNEEKKGPVIAPSKKGADKEETKGGEAPQKRVSNMDALKAQIMLRKEAMNRGAPKKGDDEEGGDKKTNLAARSLMASKFAKDDSMDEEEEESNHSDSD